MSDILKVGDLVPDISLPLLNGDTVTLKGFSGKKYILYMWASW